MKNSWKVIGVSISFHGKELPAYVEKSPWYVRAWYWVRRKPAPVKVVTYADVIRKANERMKADLERNFYGLERTEPDKSETDQKR